ncbi:MAG: response regulator [Oscillospiraceae bacterium]|nr:response regulator [Oscillospiraceae bacterium]
MNYKLLIVEDEDIIRRGLVYSVDWQSLGCTQILQAADGQEAVELIRTQRPDIIVMDLNIPFLNGIQVLEQCREEQSYSAIILTGYGDLAYARQAFRVGAVRFLLKPVNFDELEEAVEAAKEDCRRRQAYDRLRQGEGEAELPDLLAEAEPELARSDVIRRILQEVEARYSEKLTIRELATQFHYSETFLIHKFKEEMKMGFNGYLTRYRLQKAMGLLGSGQDQINQIAEQCGFPNVKYFNTVFRKHVGCLPREFRTISNRK